MRIAYSSPSPLYRRGIFSHQTIFAMTQVLCSQQTLENLNMIKLLIGDGV